MIRLVLTVVILTLSLSHGIGQKYRKHPFDFKDFNLGFLMGLNYNAYNLKEQIQVEDKGVLLERITVNPRMGLSLGMISNLNLSDHFSLRFIPTISLEQRDFDYQFEHDPLIIRKIEASYLNLPLMLQMKSKYWRSTRHYVLAGVQLGLNLGSNKKVRDDLNLLKITTHDVSLVFGFGWNLYGDRIKLSPELRYSMGLFNIYQPEFTSHADAIQFLTSQVLMLVVNFE